MRYALAAIVLSMMLIGCSSEPDRVLTLTADSSDPTVVAETQRVLLARFERFRASWLASVNSEVQGSQITFVFRNWAPDPAILEHLYATPGLLEASITKEPRRKLFDTADIRDAGVYVVDSQRRLRLRLFPEAGARVMKLTSENIGATAITTLDGVVLMEGRINGAFGESLEITGLADSGLHELAVILRSGALPTTVVAASP